ncbi:MAG: tetratricopeptide repeat protein [Planctomycetota bacterium]|jgi:tetratricopeptide (TPR) repeat protein
MPRKRFTRDYFDFIHPDLRICLFLVLAILAVYGQVWNHAFLNFDDPTYVTDNVYVKDGLTARGLQWAFSLGDKEKTYWHPLSWLSHMLDVQLHGLASGRHLLTNVFIHICNAFLLFYVLRRMTGARWPSVLVALLFALHPLNVEAVAWVTERKSVLSAFFWMLSLLAYHIYTTRPGSGRYLLVLSSFSLGLMAKPMLVTLPLVFLLLDYWPLGRLRPEKTGGKRLVSRILHLTMEKIPFLLLSAVSIFVSALSLHRHDNFISLTAVPLDVRIGNAFVSYVGYIKKMILPYDLSVYYPYPKMIPLWQLAGAVIILAGMTLAVIRHYRMKPYLLVGWLWYLGTLVPVLGLVQAGLWPAMADRFVYVAMIGLWIMIAWGAYEFVSQIRYKTPAVVVSAAVILSLMAATGLQVGHWKNSTVLFEQALQADGNNALAHNNLGVALRKQGRIGDAIVHYDTALRLKPDYPAAHHNLGLALMRVGQIDEAVAHFRQALNLKSDFGIAHKSLQTALAARRAMTEKIAEILTALERTPENHDLHYQLGNLYDRTGDRAKAIDHYHKAVKIRPDFSQALNNLAIGYAINGDYDKALSALQRLVSLQPHNPVVHYSIASVLARQNKVNESIDWLQSAIRIGFKDRNRIMTDKNLENIRRSKRYQKLIQSF